MDSVANKTNKEVVDEHQYYEERIAIMETQWKDEINRLKHQHSVDLTAYTATDRARREAEKALLVDKYKSRLNSFKEKLEIAEDAYRQKHIQILGALDESRREILSLKASAHLEVESAIIATLRPISLKY